MKKHVSWLAALALGLAAGVVTARATIQEEGGAEAPASADLDPEMMAKMMELATPGPEHEALMKGAGRWTQEYEMRWSPDAEWMESTGTSVARPILGGRYLLEEVDMQVMGMPMQGFHLRGYDKLAGEYISLWADSMSTWWATSRGQEQPDGSIAYDGTMRDMAGERPFKMVVRPEGDDLVRAAMFDTIPPHGEIEVMRFVSKRVE